ncbi:hypothetical protein T23_06050 [Turicibacter faecis]|uniref:Uncharacterized protein n=1 Tax=Turicibacter faecis TaxID=2963365 RepID=A0ABN6Z9S2_9FIRM|nr:hypothetical protein T23_06050 [Turicibacter sp. TC023]
MTCYYNNIKIKNVVLYHNANYLKTIEPLNRSMADNRISNNWRWTYVTNYHLHFASRDRVSYWVFYEKKGV